MCPTRHCHACAPTPACHFPFVAQVTNSVSAVVAARSVMRALRGDVGRAFAAGLETKTRLFVKLRLRAFYITLSVSCTSDDDLLCSVGLVGWHEDNAMSLLAGAKGLVRLAAPNYWLV